MNIKYFNLIIFSFALLLFSRTVFAASVNVKPNNRAGVYDVSLMLSPGESINAIEGTILFNENLPATPTLETGDSIIPLWAHTPAVSGNSITFSGIIPGGFSILYDQFAGKTSTQAKLFSIAFPFIKNISSYTFTFDSISLYANDNKGTLLRVSPQVITLPAITDKDLFNSSSDITPPEPFTATVESSGALFNGKYFLVFQAHDTETGVASYFIREGEGEWAPATSPYELQNQSNIDNVFIKAVDGAGNERIGTIVSHVSSFAYARVFFVALLIGFLIFAVWSIKRTHHHVRRILRRS